MTIHCACLHTHKHTYAHTQVIYQIYTHTLLYSQSFPIHLYLIANILLTEATTFLTLLGKSEEGDGFDVKRKKRRDDERKESLRRLLWAAVTHLSTSLSSPGAEARGRYLHTLWKKGTRRLTSITPDLSTAPGGRREEGRPLTWNPHPQVLQSWRKRTSREAVAALWLMWGYLLREEGQPG